MDTISLSPCVYVLELMDGCMYVGITYQLNFRLAQHWSGKGAKWTREHKPIAVKEIIYPATTDDENEKTIELMKKYGYDKVRGGKWTSPNVNYSP